MLDFFVGVWKANRELAPSRRLRIVLADMERPWKNIQQQSDWGKYNVDRDRYMADMVLADMQKRPKRNATRFSSSVSAMPCWR